MPYFISPDGSAIDFTPSGDLGSWTPCTRKEHDAALEASAIKRIRAMVRPGDSVYSVCTHQSSSGMSHRFRVFLPVRAGRRLVIQDVTRAVARATGLRLSGGEIQMGGCGYSKSFEIAYSLGWALWPKGTRKPHGTRNGEPDRAGGYALHDGRL